VHPTLDGRQYSLHRSIFALGELQDPNTAMILIKENHFTIIHFKFYLKNRATKKTAFNSPVSIFIF